jgi:hypothetical protein
MLDCILDDNQGRLEEARQRHVLREDAHFLRCDEQGRVAGKFACKVSDAMRLTGSRRAME